MDLIVHILIPKILSHYPIDKLKDMSDKPTNFDTIHISNTNCAVMYLMKNMAEEPTNLDTINIGAQVLS